MSTVVFDITLPGSTRAQLADFSAGTQDPNPIHVDEAFAKAAGFPGVLQQGPMTTAHIARLLHAKFGARLRALDLHFTAPVFPGEPLRLRATGDGARLEIVAEKADGTVTAKGVAEVAPA